MFALVLNIIWFVVVVLIEKLPLYFLSKSIPDLFQSREGKGRAWALHTGKCNLKAVSSPGNRRRSSQKCWMMPKKASLLEEVAFRQGLKDAGVLLEKQVRYVSGKRT